MALSHDAFNLFKHELAQFTFFISLGGDLRSGTTWPKADRINETRFEF